MITSILNSGFGHSVRFIAMVENLRTYTDEQVSCLVGDSMKNFIDMNVSKHNCNVYNLYHYHSFVSSKKKKLKTSIKTTDKRILHKIKTSSIVINDFFSNINSLKNLFSDKTITSCLYHGDINIANSDDYKTASFKRLVSSTASRHNVFFHINLEHPQDKPNMKCAYIPIPIISRKVTMDKMTVNKVLGLSPDDQFILIHAGSAVMENVYKDLHDFYRAVNHLKLDYRIVISSSLENNRFPFHPDIIRAPLFNNGINLINASKLVVSKPGMGILQDCIAAKKPLLFLPGDFPERNLKIKLLNDLLSGNLPLIENISTQVLKECIDQCFSISHLYQSAYDKIPTNGGEILAKAINILKDTNKADLQDTIAQIQQFSPFIDKPL
ncbi:hypothetical protein [Petroclostridium sp. X23]|uniref:hypothetical protein n=1 Tax=Petroclostridium sp. X23 TaxID=3045146 RepID=UPI0024AE72D5|nr:hypothetical protein [Petroclostridium sp. X23]WHH58349.1 hypothetical protein QKW49_21505 [Petroclostridium sp. X23]